MFSLADLVTVGTFALITCIGALEYLDQETPAPQPGEDDGSQLD